MLSAALSFYFIIKPRTMARNSTKLWREGISSFLYRFPYSSDCLLPVNQTGTTLQSLNLILSGHSLWRKCTFADKSGHSLGGSWLLIGHCLWWLAPPGRAAFISAYTISHIFSGFPLRHVYRFRFRCGVRALAFSSNLIVRLGG